VGQPLNIGIVGCGTIVNAYLATFKLERASNWWPLPT
jgi:hypothetical protein